MYKSKWGCVLDFWYTLIYTYIISQYTFLTYLIVSTLRFNRYIQQKLRENGSSRATIETDEERTFFLIDIPCNPDCLGGPILKGDMKGDMKNLSDIQKVIVSSVLDNNKITIPELARKIGMSVSKINREIRILRDDFHVMKRVGGRKDGYWVIYS